MFFVTLRHNIGAKWDRMCNTNYTYKKRDEPMKIYYAIEMSVTGTRDLSIQEYTPDEDYAKVLYFKHRREAIESANSSYNKLLEAITDRNDILKEFRPWFLKVCNKVPMFDICIKMNNSEIAYKLGKIKVYEKSDNEGILFENMAVNHFRLDILDNWKTAYNWYSLDKVPDAQD